MCLRSGAAIGGRIVGDPGGWALKGCGPFRAHLRNHYPAGAHRLHQRGGRRTLGPTLGTITLHGHPDPRLYGHVKDGGGRVQMLKTCSTASARKLVSTCSTRARPRLRAAGCAPHRGYKMSVTMMVWSRRGPTDTMAMGSWLNCWIWSRNVRAFLGSCANVRQPLMSSVQPGCA